MTSPAPADASLERRIVTVLFADLVGFTALSESLDAEDVAHVQSAYFDAVRETVGRYGGRLEKFVGDAAMAVFGIPRARDDDAERAVRAALAVTSAVEQLAARLGLEPGALQVRVGVNTGEVVTGSGSDALVTGDTVNVAARLQSAAPVGRVLLGETSALAVADAIEVEPTGELALKGKADAVRAALAVAVRSERSRDAAMGSLRAPLLGRERELAALADALAHGGRLVVVAPPGVGKTRLTDEFSRTCGDVVWRARLRPDLVAPYQPVAQLVAAAGLPDQREVTAAVTAAGATQARAGVVADALHALLEHDADRARAVAAERRAVFDAWVEGLDALAAGRRVVWLVEDVHWASPDLLAFLDAAGDSDRRLVLTTARPSLLETAPEWCRDVLHLPPLAPHDAASLVHALVGDALPPALRDLVAQRSDGNALFIEELLRTWISVGILTRAGDGWRSTAVADDVPLPPTVQAIYSAQIDDLPPAARAVARRAAVAGRRFPDAALAPLEVSDAAAGIEVLERRALLEGPLPDPLFGPTHAFRHALLRDAGYASLARAERARLHARFAAWVEDAAGGRWADVAEVIGRHYAAALEAAPRLSPHVDREATARLAAHWFERAAHAALGVSAHDTARALLRSALDLTPDDATGELARRWELLARATAYAADMAEGATAMNRAVDLYRAAGDATGLARAGAALGTIWVEQLRFDDAHELAAALLAEATDANEEATGELLVLRARATYALTNDWRLAVPDIERATDIARRRSNRDLELRALEWLAAFHTPEPEALLGVDLEAVAELAAERGEWSAAAAAWEAAAMSCVVDGRAADAAVPAARARRIAETHGVIETIAWIDYVACEAGLVTGDWHAAVVSGAAAEDLARANAYTRALIRTIAALSTLAAARGDVVILQRHAEWYEPRRNALPRSPFGLMMFTALERRFARVGLIEPREPIGTIASWDVRLRHPSWYACIEELFDTWLEAGRRDDARRGLERYDAALGRWSSPMARGVAALLHAKLDENETLAERALAEFRAADAPWWESKALRLLGRTAEARALEERLGIPA